MRNIDGKIVLEENVASVKELYFLPKNDAKLLDPPFEINGLVNPENILGADAAPAQWRVVDFITETCGFQETESQVEHGPLFTQVVECFVAKDLTWRWVDFLFGENMPVLVMAIDYDGIARLMGEISYNNEFVGAALKRDYSTERKFGNLKAYKVSFTLKAARSAFYVDVQNYSFSVYTTGGRNA
jgi:hypothetical protein